MTNAAPKKKTFQYNTKVGAVEKQYGVTLCNKKDESIGEFFKERGYPSFAELLRSKKSLGFCKPISNE
jgi:hypothetical protein